MSVPIFDDLFTAFDSVVDGYYVTGAANVASSISGVAATLFVLYLTLYGWTLMRGLVQEPVTDFTHRIIKTTVIVAMATGAGMYATYFSNFLWNWPTALTSVVTGAPAASITTVLDNVAGQGLDLAVKAWQAAGISNIGAYIIAILLFAMVLLITAVCGFILLTAKVALSLGLALGPIFILALMFDATKRFFDAWLGVVLGAGFTIVVTSMASDIAFKVFAATFTAAANSATATDGIPSLTDIAPATVAGIMIALLLFKLPQMAGALANGVSVAGAEMASWAYGRMRGVTGNTAHSVNDRMREARRIRLQNAYRNGDANTIKPRNTPLAVYRKITSPRSYRRAA